MLPCPSCARHVLGEEKACPFCFAPLRSAPTRRVPVAVMVIAVGCVLSACGPAQPDAGDMADTSSSSSGVSTSTGASGTTQGASGTTTDPTATTSGSTSIGDTTTGGSSTTLDDDTLDSVGGFYGGAPDLGGGAYECNVFMQDCVKGEKCAPWADDGGETWNSTRCTPVDPAPVSPGEPCAAEGSGVSGIDNCVAGSMCFHVDAKTNAGVCVEMCSNSEEAPVCLEGTCIVQFEGVLPLCFETCDPKVTTCAKGAACEPVADETVDTTVCVPG